MNGIWTTFELSEAFKVVDYFTCKCTEESSKVSGSSTTKTGPKRRSLYLPNNGERTGKGKLASNKIDVEDDLILNKYAPKDRPSDEKSNSDKNVEEDNTICRNDNTEALVATSSIVPNGQSSLSKSGIDTHSEAKSICKLETYGRDKIRKEMTFKTSYEDNIIVVVRRDIKNNTMALNFEARAANR